MREKRDREKEAREKEISRLKKIVDVISNRSNKYDVFSDESDILRFGVISDTHFGSLYCKFDALEQFYKLLKSEKIKTVFHCGDILDGHGIYRGQEYEQNAIGFNQQLELLIDKMPKVDNVTTYFILGNHDASYKNMSGIEVGKAIEQNRPDLKFIGNDLATIRMSTKSHKSALYQLIHPSGGTAYAVSYKSQKIIESFPGGQKPRAVFIGHYHKADMMPQWRNVRGIQAGAFQGLTPYMARKPTAAHIGGWVIEDRFGKHLSDRFKAEFVNFYEEQEVKTP